MWVFIFIEPKSAQEPHEYDHPEYVRDAHDQMRGLCATDDHTDDHTDQCRDAERAGARAVCRGAREVERGARSVLTV